MRQAALLRQRDQLLDVRAKLLRLGDGGGDLLVLDERGRHVAEQRSAMGRGPLKLTAAYAMAHGNFLRSLRGRVRYPRPGGVRTGPPPIRHPRKVVEAAGSPSGEAGTGPDERDGKSRVVGRRFPARRPG